MAGVRHALSESEGPFRPKHLPFRLPPLRRTYNSVSLGLQIKNPAPAWREGIQRIIATGLYWTITTNTTTALVISLATLLYCASWSRHSSGLSSEDNSGLSSASASLRWPVP